MPLPRACSFTPGPPAESACPWIRLGPGPSSAALRLATEEADVQLRAPLGWNAMEGLDLRHGREQTVHHGMGHLPQEMTETAVRAHVVLEAIRTAQIAVVGGHEAPAGKAPRSSRPKAASPRRPQQARASSRRRAAWAAARPPATSHRWRPA